MKGIDILVCVIIAALCVAITRYLIREKKAGHKSCGFNCSSCGSCTMCSGGKGHCHHN